LRGWLTFEYKTATSFFREQLVLDYIQNERLYGLLQNKLLIDTVLRGAAAAAGSSQTFEPIFDIARSLIGLKLPSALPKDKINKSNKNKSLSKEEIQEWKSFLSAIKNK
jgi:hypothetical protein